MRRQLEMIENVRTYVDYEDLFKILVNHSCERVLKGCIIFINY